MPKQKTHKGAQSRVKVSNPKDKKKRKVMREQKVMGKLAKRKAKNKRARKKRVEVSPQDIKVFKRLIPGL